MTALRKIFAPEPFTGWHMMGVLCLFFGTIITVNLWLAFNASSTWTGLVVKNTYVESQAFNKRQAMTQAQALRGWQADVLSVADGLDVSISGPDGKAVEGLIIRAELGRPVHEHEDRDVMLVPRGKLYHLPEKLAPGLWRLTLLVRGAAQEEWVKTLRFEVPK